MIGFCLRRFWLTIELSTASLPSPICISLYYYNLRFTAPELIDIHMYIIEVFETVRQWVDVENKEMTSVAFSSISEIVFWLPKMQTNPPIDYPQEEFFCLDGGLRLRFRFGFY